MSIHHRIATPAAKQRYVRTLFATIADRYDLITVVLSYGQDRRWKRRLVDLAAPDCRTQPKLWSCRWKNLCRHCRRRACWR